MNDKYCLLSEFVDLIAQKIVAEYDFPHDAVLNWTFEDGPINTPAHEHLTAVARQNAIVKVIEMAESGEFTFRSMTLMPVSPPLLFADFDRRLILRDEAELIILRWFGAPQTPLVDVVEDDNIEPPPPPLTTNEVANCFAGLREWDVGRWKRELGSPENWLKACQHTKGTRGRGGYQSTWLPVQIAAALVRQDPKSVRTLRIRFAKQEPLKPWFDFFQISFPE